MCVEHGRQGVRLTVTLHFRICPEEVCKTIRYLLTYLLTSHLLTLLTYLLTPWSRVRLDKLTSSQPVKKFPASYGTRRFLTAFTSARHLSLSWVRLIQSMPSHPTSWRAIFILFSHLRLGLPCGFFPSGFPTKILYTPLLSHIRATCPTHLFLVYFITRTVFSEEYRSLSFPLCAMLQFPLTSSLLGPNILLSTLFSNTLSLRPSLSVIEQVSHSY